MQTTYDPQTIEQHWYKLWEQSGYFKANGSGQPYCIMLPPPNVTGTLHMGHGFQMTLMDALIRYHRMLGDNTLWQAGTDHAGIATQMVVERQLVAEGKSRIEIGREAFLARVWEWQGKSENTILQQMRRLGTSPDWSRTQFMLDDHINQAVHEVFMHLYEEGLIYRGKRLVNWDPVLLTAVSDLEVISEEQNGHLWHIRYPLLDGTDYIIVATTRPETMLGDVAVAINPDDARYHHLIGKKIKLPLTDRIIPIIADDSVDATFGTGFVKITPAHDFNDYATAQRHQLPLINIFTPQAHINNEAPEEYRGLERYEARKKVVADLEALGLLEKIENYQIKIPKGDRSGAVIEPYLTDQWFINAKVLAQPALAAVKKGDIKFIPEQWTKTYYQWLENIQDWCISRQLWWGHRIPAWYDEKGNVYVGKDETQVRHKFNLSNDIKLTQDPDVLDTWFSAALWPFVTLGWPTATNEFKTFYPTNVLITGFDIIFFWVARMIMMGLHFTGKVPFREVYITGLIRDAEGQKMSKSKGNILDPLDLIDGISLDDLLKKRTSGLMQPQMAKKIDATTRKEFPEGIAAFGTDALRFTYCALATPGREIRFDLGRLEGYRNFCNKIWNAARYVLMNTEGHDTGINNKDIALSLADRWIRSRLHHLVKRVQQDFANYRFDLLAQALYEFIWNEYCDWYLEFSKPILTDKNSPADLQRGTRQTLVQVLETILRLVHPLLPFITEEIWQKLAPLAGKKGTTIMLQHYPTPSEFQTDPIAETDIEWLKKIILAIRNIRGEMQIAPGKALSLIVAKADTQAKQRLQQHQTLLMFMAKLASIQELAANETLPPSATAIADHLELHIPLADFIDRTAETNRLRKEISKQQIELEKCQQKLANPTFVEKAPAEVVTKERDRALEFQRVIEKLEEQLLRIQKL